MEPELQRLAIAKVVCPRSARDTHTWDGRCDNRYFECELCGDTQSWSEYKRAGAHPHGPCTGTKDNYPEDLNAMHSAEQTLKADQFPTYLDMLDVACGGELELSDMVDGADFGFGLVHATAAQRAEAFLKTLGLWQYDS